MKLFSNLYCKRGHYRSTKTLVTSTGSKNGCKQCRVINQLRSMRKTRYGITNDQFTNLYAFQNGKCFICISELNKSAQVDHDHITGQVRGLLCRACNTALGMLKDNVEYIQRARVYLTMNTLLNSAGINICHLNKGNQVIQPDGLKA